MGEEQNFFYLLFTHSTQELGVVKLLTNYRETVLWFVQVLLFLWRGGGGGRAIFF